MPDYKKMYFKLYRAHCKVLATLEKATYKTEKMAVEAKEPITLPVDNKGGIEGDKGKNSVFLFNRSKRKDKKM